MPRVPSSASDFAACARCGYCNAVCPTYAVLGWESSSPRGRLRAAAEGRRDLGAAGRRYDCTLCGRCAQVCPVDYDLPALWHHLRGKAVEAATAPPFVERLARTVDAAKNVFDLPNDERAEWVAFMTDAPADAFTRPRAEVLYYVGCVSSFSPAVQGIPQDFARLLTAAGVDFTLAGGEEWCCGFPLRVAGLAPQTEALRRHNLERLAAIGAQRVVFTCPSCLREWREHYGVTQVELLSAAEFLDALVREGRLALGPLNLSVTYHDPCDLGRGCGIFEAPRRLLAAVPGLKLRELPEHHLDGVCCGGGGDFEMRDAAAAGEVAAGLARMVRETAPQAVATACPQCQRMLQEGLHRLGEELPVWDLAQILQRSRQEGSSNG
ncbi:MAG: (Fe-S)-binding protein [Thermaerobacter sp.]|nr:(Fe-S)-binding protein [Thermaerobacter sp.]